MPGDIDLGIPGISTPELIGRGGYSVVYRARQDLLDHDVAVKVLAPLALDEEVRHRFERECNATGALSWHPNIVRVYEAGVTTGGRP